MKMERESGLELLRIFCMFGIISMHTFGNFLDTCTGSNMVYGCIINSIFNMGVSIFALIAGYFGNSGSTDKIIKMWLVVIQYSLMSLGGDVICNGIDINNINCAKKIIHYIFPVFTGKYWFFSCYIVLMLLAEPINLFINVIEKKQFKKFLLRALFIFSFMPTLLLGVSITKDKGKGLVNFLLMFFIGRYINKYISEVKIPRHILGGGGIGVIIGIEIVLNLIVNQIVNRGYGLVAPFGADNSMFIICGSLCIFMFFKDLKFYSKIVNAFASATFAMYLFEGTVREIINQFVMLQNYSDSLLLPGIIILVVIIVMVVCYVIEVIRRKTIARIELRLIMILKNVLEKNKHSISELENRLQKIAIKKH